MLEGFLLMKAKLVKIVWYDAYSVSGWKSADKAKEYKMTTNTTIGWLVAKTKHFYFVSSTKDDDSYFFNSHILIPKAIVKKKKWL